MTKRILIIDDEVHWIQFAKSDLVQSSFEIIVASSTEEALKALALDDIDLVIAGSRHLEAVHEIKQLYGDETIIVVTVYPSPSERIKAYDAGAFRYYPKDFKPNSLSERVDLLELVST